MTFACVILAAGEGRRAGGCKPLMDLGGIPVVDRVIAAATAACPRIVVVGGCRFEALRDHLAERHPAVEVVRNGDWARGMFSSVRRGLAAVDAPAFVHPADVPGVGPGVFSALALAYEAGPCAVLRPTFGGRRGHPVLLGPGAVTAVLAAGADSNLREVLAPLPGRDVAVDDPLVLRDFDTPEDLDSLRAELGARAPAGG
jgi:molybdenum cofactor cytidylyltransferase